MKVGELIEKLKALDPNLDVCIVDHVYGTELAEDVRVVPEERAPRVFKKAHVVID